MVGGGGWMVVSVGWVVSEWWWVGGGWVMMGGFSMVSNIEKIFSIKDSCF